MKSARLLLILTFCLISFLSYSQERAVRTYLESVRQGSYDPVPEQILSSNNPSNVLNALVAYQQDSVVKVRTRAYNIASRVGLGSSAAQVRRQAVDQLVGGIGDTDGGVSGVCSSYLTDFKVADFSSAAQQQLLSYLTPLQFHIDQVVKLVAFVGVDEALSKLQTLQNQVTDRSDKWAIRLALARLGDTESISYITSRLNMDVVNDDFVYDVVPDLIYTRAPQVYDFLEQIIQSDDANCQSADPDRNTRILCGYRLLEYIAYTIVDFPIGIDEDQEAQIDDYEQALLDVRSWFAQNPEYELVKAVY